MANFSRRQFLVTAGVSAASSIFLKACVGNPPSTTNTGTGNTGTVERFQDGTALLEGRYW